MDEPPRGSLGIAREQLAQQRRVDRPRAQRVDAHATARELHAELSRKRQHAPLRGGVGDLRDRRPHHGDERGGVDHRAPARVEQMRDAVLAAQKDAAQVRVLDALPHLERGLEHRGVLAGIDSRVVEKHVDAAELLARACIDRAHLPLVADVSLQRKGALGALAQVDAHHIRALGFELPRRLCADAAGGPRDHAHLVLQAAAHHATRVA